MEIVYVLTAVCLLLISYVFIRKWKSFGGKQPPGPMGLPIVGYSWYLKPRVFKAFMKLKSDYPDIMRVNFGLQSMVILTSYRAIKEALITKGENFSARPRNLMREELKTGKGIIDSDGSQWKEHRRFALHTLRDFGFGRNKAEEIVQHETQHLIDYISKEIAEGRRDINDMDLLLRSVSNVISSLAIGGQPGYEDEEFTEIMQRIRYNLGRPIFTAIPVMFPGLFEYCSPFVKLIPRVKQTLANLKRVTAYLQTKIDQHTKEFDPNQECRDYVDAFLLKQYKENLKSISSHTYTSAELQREIFELFIAGTDTTSNSLSWGLLLLAIHPNVQRRCHEEVDQNIGRERMPTMKDKENMPYVLAVLDEVQRYASIVPMGLIHRNFEADTLQGYHIPASTPIVSFVYGAHHDSRVWEKPEEFYPEHFLSSSEERVTYRPREELIPFLIGKRECLGESLAKMELFIFFVSFLQKYKMSLPEYEKEHIEEILLGSDGLIHSPGPHKLHFQLRS